MLKTNVQPARIAACIMGMSLVAFLLIGCSANKGPVQEEKKNYAFWPAPPDLPRIQYLISFNSSQDISPAKGGLDELIYGKEPEQTLAVSKPYGVEMYNGAIYVCDVRGDGVIVLDVAKKQTRLMGAQGTGAVQKAVDIAIAPDGLKYVADPNKGSVAVFDQNERFMQAFTDLESSPVGVAVYGDELFVADFKQQHVKVLNRFTGQVIRKIGEAGGADGEFVRPLSVGVDKQGHLYVTDVIKCRVQKFSREGKLLAAFGTAGNRPGNFVRPKHIAVSGDGVTYVADAAFNNVQLFDEEGKVLMYFGSAGTHPGAMDLPAGLAIYEGDPGDFQQYVHPAFKAERLIIVTNQFGDQKVSVYAMGQLREGKTLADVSNRADVNAGVEQPGATTQPATPAGAATQPSAAAR